MTVNRLFVYGSLGPGRPNEHILTPLRGTWRAGTVYGQLLEEGWGAQLGYPGIVLSPDGGDAVNGWVYEGGTLEDEWNRLDEFEGPGYHRELTDVHREDGETVRAWIYVLGR